MEVMTGSSDIGHLAAQAKDIAQAVQEHAERNRGVQVNCGVASLALAVEVLADAIALLPEAKDR